MTITTVSMCHDGRAGHMVLLSCFCLKLQPQHSLFKEYDNGVTWSMLTVKQNIYNHINKNVNKSISILFGPININMYVLVLSHSEKSSARPMLFYSTNYWQQF